MQKKCWIFTPVLVCLLVSVVGCGGSGGGATASNPTPTPIPSPTPAAPQVAVVAPSGPVLMNSSVQLPVTVKGDPNFPSTPICAGAIASAPNGLLTVANISVSPANGAATFNAGNTNPGVTTGQVSCHQGNGPSGTGSFNALVLPDIPHLVSITPPQIPNDIAIILLLTCDNFAMARALPNESNPTEYAGDQVISNPQFLSGIPATWVDPNNAKIGLATHNAPATGTPLALLATPDPGSMQGGGLSNFITLGNGPLPPAATVGESVVFVLNGGDRRPSTAFVYNNGALTTTVPLGIKRVTNPVTLGNSVVIASYEGKITRLNFDPTGRFAGSEVLKATLVGHPVSTFSDGTQIGFITESVWHAETEFFVEGATPAVDNKVEQFDGATTSVIRGLPSNIRRALFINNGIVFTDTNSQVGFTDESGTHYLQTRFSAALLQGIDANHVAVAALGGNEISLVSYSGSQLRVDETLNAAMPDDQRGIAQIASNKSGQIFITKESGRIITFDPDGSAHTVMTLNSEQLSAGITVSSGMIHVIGPDMLGRDYVPMKLQ